MELYYYKLKIPLLTPFTTSFGTDINNSITAYSESMYYLSYVLMLEFNN
ncbi:hypothetical protein [Acidiplasma sp.]|nr:hypothetical protein [Acidiplasma sp.]